MSKATTLIIARHGNTFEKGQPPTRVGGRTDLPLVESGEEQARKIGRFLSATATYPDVIYASKLERTLQTAKLALKEAKYTEPVYALDIFNEIDYGPDENKTEEDVIARIGKQAIADWDEHAKVPDGWLVDPDQIIKNWLDFGEHITKEDEGDVVMVVTSNGIARFAPHLTGNFEGFRKENDIKISTGALCILHHDGKVWTIKGWNIKP